MSDCCCFICQSCLACDIYRAQNMLQCSLGVQERHLPKQRTYCLPCLHSQLLFDAEGDEDTYQRDELMPYKFTRPGVKDKKASEGTKL